MKAPTRALVLEDIELWVGIFGRAARRAGVSEIVTCRDLDDLRSELRKVRFDVAIVDIGLDPDDDVNSDGVRALEMIRAADGDGTRCVLVTGWQGDRMDLQADVTRRLGVEWAYMKEKYDARALINKLSELLADAPERRVSAALSPMANLCACADPMRFEAGLLAALSPSGGITTLYDLCSRLLTPASPIVAYDQDDPMVAVDGSVAGRYWSRALGGAIAVELSGAASGPEGHEDLKEALRSRYALSEPPELLLETSQRSVSGRLWELPGIDRDDFPESAYNAGF